MGTGVMIGAGIFALTGQVADLAGEWFPFAFLAAAVVTAFSAYSYVKLSNAYPSAGVIAMLLTVFFDLSRIASLGAILYIVMDIAVNWGVIRHLRNEIAASPVIPSLAIVFDVLVLAALLIIKAQTDSLVIYAAMISLVLIFAGERLFLRGRTQD